MRRGGGKPAAGRRCSEKGVEELAEILLEPTRLLVVAVLAEGCRRFIELQRILGVSKGSLYFHLNVLEENCLVEKRYRLSSRDRPALYLCLTRRARSLLPVILDLLISRLERIRDTLATESE